MRAIGLMAFVGVVMSLCGGAPQSPTTDSGKLQGTWRATSLMEDGKEVVDELEWKCIFASSTLIEKVHDYPTEATYKLDPTKVPKEIDVVNARGPFRGRLIRGIYSLDGDSLKLCFPTEPEGDRPTVFASPPGGKKLLWILKRDPAAKDAEEYTDPEKIKRRRSREALEVLWGAMIRYEEKHGRYPPGAVFSADEKPLLSWRLLLLPYLSEGWSDKKDILLFKEFKMDEPWDSPHNKKLIPRIPEVYASAGGKEPGTTYYQLFVGDKTVFGQRRSKTVEDSSQVSDFRSIMIIEGGEAVPWTKPADLPYISGMPLPQVGGFLNDGFHYCAFDGKIKFLKKGFDEKMLRKLITTADDEIERR